MFSPERFFDLSEFSHKEIFQGCEFVWQALEKIEQYLSRKMLGKIDTSHQEYAYFVNPESISIGEGTIVEPGAYIRGPCIIGNHCHIRHGAYIRGNAIIGDHCVIGHATEIKHAILLNHAKAAHFAFVGDSILGNYVNLGAGTKCANLRLHGDEVIIRSKHESIATGQRKLGAIIGDYCQVGCNAVLNPGTVFGKHVHCYPCTSVSGSFLEKCTIKPETKIETIPS
jgi:NDP-sugar pyrophosphorylase family protein